MAIDSVSGSSTTTTQMSGSRAGIADNFDTFLSILTTQLKNQNPMDPLDTNQFTAQLVQFTGVEQQRDRWKRCVDATSLAMPELLGQPYVARKFPGASKTAAGAYSAVQASNPAIDLKRDFMFSYPRNFFDRQQVRRRDLSRRLSFTINNRWRARVRRSSPPTTGQRCRERRRHRSRV